MAALDFGMALARGMLPTSEKAQKDLINLAGGRNIFKSEDWWNQAVDKQISEGYREAKQETQYLTKSGYKPPAKTTTAYGRMMYGKFQPTGIMQQPTTPYGVSYQQAPGMGGGAVKKVSDVLPKGAVKKDGRAVSKEFEVFRDANRKDYTAGELSDIEESAKAGAQRARRQTAQSKAAQKRMRRGTAGLAAKAMKIGDKPVTGLPELGTGGLGIGATTLGKGLLV